MPIPIADVTQHIPRKQSRSAQHCFSLTLKSTTASWKRSFQADAESLSVSVWGNIQDREAKISTDIPADVSTHSRSRQCHRSSANHF
jgi:hypothetical protein